MNEVLDELYWSYRHTNEMCWLYCTGEGICEVCEHKYECSGSPESEEEK